MASIFRKSINDTNKPNRNTFDLSFVNNLTCKFGQITPCFLREVVPGDSINIDAKFGFNLMPMTFPVQTNIKATMHFFYVRNRALWKGWQDFITKTENKDSDSTPPYIMLTEENRDMVDTGKIGDYLGIPSVAYFDGTKEFLQSILYSPAKSTYVEEDGDYWINDYIYAFQGMEELETRLKSCFANTAIPSSENLQAAFDVINGSIMTGLSGTEYGVNYFPLPWQVVKGNYSTTFTPYMRKKLLDGTSYLRLTPHLISSFATMCYSSSANGPLSPMGMSRKPYNPSNEGDTLLLVVGDDGKVRAGCLYTYEGAFRYDGYNFNTLVLTGGVLDIYLGSKDSGNTLYIIPLSWTGTNENIAETSYMINETYANYVGTSSQDQLSQVNGSYGIPNKALSLFDLPFANANAGDSSSNDAFFRQRISALPFRAVEAVYNSFFRDIRNNPLIIDGKELYNVYAVNTDGGADTTHYELYQHNWADDFLTTAVQSPQQGAAPLVGVTSTGQMTFQDENGQTFYLQAEFGEDGETITGIKSYSSDMPVGTLRAMVDTISTGISINDFRNVNALQRWLERNMRKGLRYKDQLEAHFGVSPTYSELDMPEFIGGMSRNIQMNKVVQTTETADHPLGTLAGNGSFLGDAGQRVTKFCDEHGWIIGFITFTPEAVYSQQLNKQLMKTELLDYYFPEFAHIGFQPILNKEVAPLQCTPEQMNDVFAYQRAWYEYLSSVDEVHGDFRETLKDYIISRKYKGVPQLGKDFLTISTDEANDVFAVRDDTDKIFGQIYFDCKMKRPIPEYGIPKLEVD